MRVSNKLAAGLAAALLAGTGMLVGQAGPLAAQTVAADTRGTPEERAKALLDMMTRAEKLSLVKGYFGSDVAGKFKAPAEARADSAGYVPGIPRLGIPPQWQTDAGIGVATQGNAKVMREATALPSGLAMAATWDPDMATLGGQMIGSEARASGFNVMLAGAVNLEREPRNGRNFEYAGEDPLLAGTMVGAFVAGVQSNHIISTVKHYAVNAQETDRDKLNAVVDEDALRQSDLLAFQLAIEKGNPGSVMCAYNKVNGTYACENEFLLNEVLRKDWGYRGYVMSDWGAAHSTAASAKAGLDQETGYGLQTDDYYGAKLVDALANGSVDGKDLDRMVLRILTAMFEHGLIDYPLTPGPLNFRNDQAISRVAAEAGAVLLKNDGNILPLVGVKHIAIIGGHADVGVLSGGGSSQVYASATPKGGNAVPGLEPVHWPGPVFYNPSSPLEELKAQLPNTKIDYIDGSNVVAAQLLAGEADVVIVFATQWASESIDAPLSLPGNQDKLIAAVAKANDRTVVVLETGGPVLTPWAGDVKGILEAWYPGRMGGLAIANLLTGKANPSGHLPVTFPASAAQLPHPGDPQAGTVTYDEGAAVGYKWFDLKGETPAFPFGHGLSYSDFGIDDYRVDVRADNRMVATVRMTNTGTRAGAQVIQLYASYTNPDKDAAWEAPRRLVGFAKFDLKPGETQTKEIEIDPRLLATYKDNWRGWVIGKGNYVISAGLSSRALVGNIMLPLKLRYLKVDWKPGDK